MKNGPKATIWMLAVICVSASARAVAPDTSNRPYQGIVDRNVFDLHAPPPPVDPNELAKSKIQIPKLTLNGITTILGTKNVFLTLPATKPGSPPETLMLAEGQAEDEVEVKQIDEQAGVVKVVNHGENQTLDFDHNGTKPPPPPANAAAPVNIPPVPAAPPSNVMPPPQNPIRPLRTLNSRTTPLSSAGSGFGAGIGSSANATQNPPTLSPEQQTVLIEAQRMKALQEGDPMANILPLTEFTPEVTGAAGGGAEQAPQ
jgi:hypothetical protein